MQCTLPPSLCTAGYGTLLRRLSPSLPFTLHNKRGGEVSHNNSFFLLNRRSFCTNTSNNNHKATPKGTSKYFERLSSQNAQQTPLTTQLPQTNWLVGKIGFNGQKIGFSEGKGVQSEAISLSLRNGCNVIQVSGSFEKGQSEELIGATLNRLFEENEIQREEVVVVNRIGYTPSLSNILGDSAIFPTLSPSLLQSQITQSLENLDLKCIDLALLHLPPTDNLLQIRTNSPSQTQTYSLFDSLLSAFLHLESEVEQGRIQYYGLTSREYSTPSSHKTSAFTQTLTNILDTIRSKKGAHHFVAVEYPLNLFEAQGSVDGISFPKVAHDFNLIRLSQRPLSAFFLTPTQKDPKYVRFATVDSHSDIDITKELKEKMDQTIHLEETCLLMKLREKGVTDDNKNLPASKDISWGRVLASSHERLRDLWEWKFIVENQIKPTLDEALQKMSSDPRYLGWTLQYRVVAREMLKRYTWALESIHSSFYDKMKNEVECLWNEGLKDMNLSQMALKALIVSGQSDVVLTGMRTPEYVEQFLLSNEMLRTDYQTSPPPLSSFNEVVNNAFDERKDPY
eukprot:TRINITY_DN3808_c0_g1_i1.p1 TRINITY_DN3808_c0_g1~~TRINITY_DN3808_c0_g1_i1.p1  ORF type:complete len:566 (-),score=121.37 TRINITY_DN3808_c0_g1_i1:55-1752(-)